MNTHTHQATMAKAREDLARIRSEPMPEPAPSPRVTSFRIGRTWSDGSYGNYRLEFTIEIPTGFDVAEVIRNATENLRDMDPRDTLDPKAIAEELDKVRACRNATDAIGSGFYGEPDTFLDWRSDKIADLEANLLRACQIQERRDLAAERMNDLICLAAHQARA